ncbi:MAG: hypothetical protein ACE5I1_11520 [bacterium]
MLMQLDFARNIVWNTDAMHLLGVIVISTISELFIALIGVPDIAIYNSSFYFS